MKNIFYHYTASQFISGIEKHGLTKGKTPVYIDKTLNFLTRTQWISKDSNPDNQLWAIPVDIKYTRRGWRLKINILEPFMKNVLPMTDFMEQYRDYLPKGFNDFPEETKDWYVYQGCIPSRWIEQIRKTGY